MNLEFVVKESKLFLLDEDKGSGDPGNLLQFIILEITENNGSHIVEGSMEIVVQYRGTVLLPGTLLHFTGE